MSETVLQDVFTLQIRRSTNHYNPSPYCEACKNGFVHVNSLQVRQFTQSGKLPGVCKTCNEAFLKICRLQIRHLTQTEHHPHVCPHCNKTFTHAGNIKKHLLIHDNGQANLNKATNYPNDLTDKPKPPFICQCCHRTFVKYGSFLKHIKQHTIPPDNSNEISTNKEAENNASRELNGETSSGNNGKNEPIKQEVIYEKPFKCDLCEKAFLRYGCLVNHYQTHEAEAESLMCQVCQQIFNTKPLLSSHMRTHKHVCKLCKEVFAIPEELEVHLQNHMQEQSEEIASAKIPNFFCSVCQKGFFHEGFLRKHLRVMHSVVDEQDPYVQPKTEEKPKVALHCSICNQRFRLRRTLKKHMATHKE